MDSTVSGFAPRASRFFILLAIFIIQAAAQSPPGAPIITAPQTIKRNDQITLTCTVNGGSPPPSVKWLRDDIVIDETFTTTQSSDGPIVVNTYSFVADDEEHLEVFECQSDNGVLQNPLSRTIFVEVWRPPTMPVLVGPNEVLPGAQTTWTCTSMGGYPAQKMSMRIGNNVFTNELTTNTAYVAATESYTVTGTLLWAPTTANNQQTLFCDVTHAETLSTPQTVSKVLTVRSPLAVNAPRTLYEPTTGQTITLTCQVTSGTATSITWYKDSQLLNLNANSRLSGASPGAPSMTISNVQTSDVGNYICSASDGSATRNTSTITVTPRASPTQPTLVGPTSMTAGSSGTWTCTSIGGFPLQTMSMRINNVVVNSNELSINSQYNSNLRTYTVVGTLNKALNMGHNGQTLFCDVTHPQTLTSPQTVSLPLTVRSPLAVTAPTTFYNPEEEEDVTLNCIVTTGTATGINWYKNNNRLTVGANQRFSGGLPNSPSLTITDVEIADGGNYICEATDGSATVRTNSIQVTVRERPWLEYDIITYVLDGYNKLVRPRDPVINVTHSLIPREIFEFEGGKKFVLQAMQCMSWNDPRLTWPKGQPRISLPSSVIWLPDVVLFGQKYVPDFEAKVIVTKDGTVVYCPQGPITATNCEEKSGEVYECDFRFLSWSYDKVMLDKHFPGLISDPSIDMSIYLEHDHYEIVSRCAVRREMTYPCRDGTYPELKYTFVLRRRRSFCRNLNQSPTSPLAVNAPKTLYDPSTGQTIELTCVVTSGTATGISWYRNNQLLVLAFNNRYSGGSPQSPSLTISNVQLSDAGNYVCSATDGSVTRNTSTITVAPKATPTQPTLTGPQSLLSGTTGTWTCTSIGGFPLQTMSMRINNQVFASNVLSINSQYDSNTRSYRVVGTLNWAPNMGNNGQTMYCDVTHPETLTSPQTVSLPLTVRSPLAVNAPKTLYDPSTGQTIELTCVVTSGTATGITWYKNNQPVIISFNNRYSGGSVQTPSLTISNVQLIDAGNYVCSATDGSVTVNTNTITVAPKATPSQPTLTGSTSLLSGTTGTWTCTSIGGFPLQTMSMRINNQVFASNFLSINSQYDTTSRSYRVVGTLNWAPNMVHNGQTMYCDVTHPQTLTSPQTVSLPLTVRSPLAVNAPKTLYDPSTGQTIELTCVVTSGTATGITWYKNNQPVVISFNNQYSGGSVNTPTLTISNVQLSDAGNYVCSATDGSVTRNTSIITVSVKATPTQPTLTGPQSLLSGTTGTWTCTSIGGFPLQTMSMRINNQVFASNVLSINSQYDTTSRSYRVVGTLNWAPNMGNNGQTMYCDVTHPQTLTSPQTVSLPLTVRSPLAVNAPQNLYEPTTGQTVILECRITAGTATGITWYKNGQMVNKASDFRLSGALASSPSLTISNVRLTDTGNYICSATDGSVTRNTSTITVTAKATPTQPTLTGPTALTAGTPGTWTCTSIGAFPAQSMSMRINNQVFSQELSVNTQFNANARSYTAVGTLNWSPTMVNNGQTIFCDVTHPDTLNGPQTVSLPLTVRSPLAVNAPTTFYNPMEDETVTLNCVVTSGTATGIKWYKNTVQINIAANTRITGATTNSPSITMTDVVLSDGGSYTCEATDGFATVSTNTITVTVREKPWLEYNIITYVLKDYNKLVRPVDPVNNLTHSLIPQQIFEFDGKKRFVLQSMQCMNWNDPRLTWPKGQPRISLPSSEIWIPDIVLLGHKYESDFHTKVIVMKNGDVTYCPQGPLISTNCQEKSGEVYECNFKFLSWSYDKVMLDKYFPGFASRPSIDMSIFYEHDEYEIVSRCAVRREMTYPCRDGTYPELTYTFVLRRRRSFCRNLNQSPTCN